jgi:hypothetical protein
MTDLLKDWLFFEVNTLERLVLTMLMSKAIIIQTNLVLVLIVF